VSAPLCNECGHVFDGPDCCVNEEAPFYAMDLDTDNVSDLLHDVSVTLSPNLFPGIENMNVFLLGIVSAEAGGIIAYAIGDENADLIVTALAKAARS
jgi:hypothetical protein